MNSENTEITIQKQYYQTGQIYVETPYVNGQKHGIEKMYRRTGQIWYEIPYENGKRNGIQKMYRETGQIWYATSYQNDYIHGIDREYYESGQLKNERKFQYTRLQGIERDYSETGEILLERNWGSVEEDQEIQFEIADLSLFESCSICLKDKEECIEPVALKCHNTHIFCLQCIQNWTNSQKKCPICRTPIESE